MAAIIAALQAPRAAALRQLQPHPPGAAADHLGRRGPRGASRSSARRSPRRQPPREPHLARRPDATTVGRWPAARSTTRCWRRCGWTPRTARRRGRPLTGVLHADLLVVGGGFTGLWTALRAVERDPGLSVVLVEADRIAEHATGRNGGFCEASLTHGEANGRTRWPDEYDRLHELGHAQPRRHRGDGRALRHRLRLRPRRRARGRHPAARGRRTSSPDEPGFLDAAAVRALVDSPTYLAGRLEPDGTRRGRPGPARVGAGGRGRGARRTHRTSTPGWCRLRRRGGGVRGRPRPARSSGPPASSLATNVFRSLLRRPPLVGGPGLRLRAGHRAADRRRSSPRCGWDPGIGISDSGNQFHYYRVTPGPPDPVGRLRRDLPLRALDRSDEHDGPPGDLRDRSPAHFARDLPAAAAASGSRTAGPGVIDTSTRFCALFGTAHRGPDGVRDRLHRPRRRGLPVRRRRDARPARRRGRPSAPGCEMVRTPAAAVPARAASPGSASRLTRWSLAREDATGRRNPWLRLLDRLGLGFDS